MTLQSTILDRRGVVALAGEDARNWLQGLISNDVAKIAPDRAVFASLLTPQGKFLFDFFVIECGGKLLLDTDAGRIPDLLKRLNFYRLRSKVAITDVSTEFAVAAAAGETAAARLGLGAREPGAGVPFAGGVAFIDPRLGSLGCRVIAPRADLGRKLVEAGFKAGLDYDAHRLGLGVPDGSLDMQPDGTFLLESNAEELHGVDFDKGCYVGQETTTRTKRRGVIRRRLLPVVSQTDLPPFGTPIFLGDREAGELRSVYGHRGMALMRLDVVTEARRAGNELHTANGIVTVEIPDWIAPSIDV